MLIVSDTQQTRLREPLVLQPHSLPHAWKFVLQTKTKLQIPRGNAHNRQAKDPIRVPDSYKWSSWKHPPPPCSFFQEFSGKAKKTEPITNWDREISSIIKGAICSLRWRFFVAILSLQHNTLSGINKRIKMLSITQLIMITRLWYAEPPSSLFNGRIHSKQARIKGKEQMVGSCMETALD